MDAQKYIFINSFHSWLHLNIYITMMKNIFLFLKNLVLIIQIYGQVIVRDQCQSQTTTVNDLWMEFRKLKNDYMSLRQKYEDSQIRIVKLEDELREIKETSGEWLYI